MTKNPQGKTRNRLNPYEIWISKDGTWEWRVLKKYQLPENEAKNQYARWFCNVRSPHVPDGEYGDTYVTEIKEHAIRCNACPVCGEYTLFPKPFEARNAVSRKDNKTYICSACGTKEGLMDWAKSQKQKEVCKPNINECTDYIVELQKEAKAFLEDNPNYRMMSLVERVIFVATEYNENQLRKLWYAYPNEIRDCTKYIIEKIGEEKLAKNFLDIVEGSCVYGWKMAIGKATPKLCIELVMTALVNWLMLRRWKLWRKLDKDRDSVMTDIVKIGGEFWKRKAEKIKGGM